jgi:hypothetical protein
MISVIWSDIYPIWLTGYPAEYKILERARYAADYLANTYKNSQNDSMVFCSIREKNYGNIQCAEPPYFDAAPAAPAFTLSYTKPTF